ncbi:MAG TPA: HNH endonuclease signature motif containing protein, partial [Aquihabitans sp.]|nr:HNH endonuclease signature motif containing protein [Aquihabitans sp.]
KAAKTLGGEVDLRARLDPIGGAVVSNELERLERELFEADWAAAREVHGDAVRLEHLARTGPQRHADALILMATRSAHLPADATPARVLVTVLVDLDTFTTALRYARGEAAAAQVSSSRPRRTTPAERAEDRVCELSDGTVLTPGQVAAWLADADVERIVFGPGSRVVDVAIRTRCFTGATRRAVEVRDRHCTFPGCRVPAERCHVDHIVEYSDGGLTVQDNGRLLCPAHNRQRLGRSSPPADGP